MGCFDFPPQTEFWVLLPIIRVYWYRQHTPAQRGWLQLFRLAYLFFIGCIDDWGDRLIVVHLRGWEKSCYL